MQASDSRAPTVLAESIRLYNESIIYSFDISHSIIKLSPEVLFSLVGFLFVTTAAVMGNGLKLSASSVCFDDEARKPRRNIIMSRYRVAVDCFGVLTSAPMKVSPTIKSL
jgi:hypothetical protein